MKYPSENFENIYCFSVIDRTGEFNSIIKYSKSKNETSRKNYQRTRHSKFKDFLNVSKKISKDLAQTDEKLESLTLIVSELENENSKKREPNSQWMKQGVVNEGMVGEDGDGNIGGMHVVVDLHKFIKQDINVLNKDIEKLEQYVKKQSSYNKHTTQHSNAIVLTLQSRLVSLSSEFKVFLQSKKDLLTEATRTNKSKDHRKNNLGQSYEINNQKKPHTYGQPQNTPYQQQQQFLKSPPQQNNDHHQKQNQQYAIQQGYSTQSPKQQNSINNSFNNNQTNYNNSSYDSHVNNGPNNTRQDYKNELQHYNNTNQNTQNHQHYNNTNNTDFLTQPTNTSSIPNNNQQQMLRQRRGGDEMVRGVDEVGAIEQTIVELGGVFQQLATMVNEQADVVCRIDSHVDETSVNVEAGHGELLKYLRSVSQTRAFMLKVFVVLIIFFLLFSYMIR